MTLRATEIACLMSLRQPTDPTSCDTLREQSEPTLTSKTIYSNMYILNSPIHYHCIQCCFPLFIGTVENTIPMSHWPPTRAIFTFLHIQQIHHTAQSHTQSTQLPLHPSRSHSLSQPPQLRKAKAITIDLTVGMVQQPWVLDLLTGLQINSLLCTFVVGVNKRPCIDDSWQQLTVNDWEFEWT